MKPKSFSAEDLLKAAERASLAEDFPAVIVDQAAETRAELLKKWPKTVHAFDKFSQAKVNDGEWERVYKRVDGLLKPAYRRRSTPPRARVPHRD